MKAMLLLAALPLAGCMTITPDDARRVTYACDGGEQLKVVYAGSTAQIDNPGGPKIQLQRMTGSSGVMYSSNSRRIRGEGDVITYEAGRSAPVTCRAVPAGQ